MMTEADFALKDRLRRAVHDPGAVVGRRLGPTWGEGNDGYAAEQETLWDWVVRAVYATTRPAPADTTPQVRVIHGDQVELVGSAEELLALLNYEQLLVLQERVGDAIGEMVFMPDPEPTQVKRPRKKERDGNTHEGPAA